MKLKPCEPEKLMLDDDVYQSRVSIPAASPSSTSPSAGLVLAQTYKSPSPVREPRH